VSSSGHATSSVKPEDFSSILDKFATTLIKAISSSQPSTSQPPRNNNQGPMNPSRDYPANVCIFCGLSDHYINSCLVCAQYITDGKCKRNQDNKIVLPNGMFVPRAIPGIWIKERIDEWHRRNTPVATAAQMFYGVTTASAPSHAVAHQVITSNIVPRNISDESRIAELERELFVLCSGRNLTPGIIRRLIEEPSTNDTSNYHRNLPPPPMVVIPTRTKAPAPARVPEPTPAPIIDDSIITQPSKSLTSQLPAPPEIIVTPPGEKEVEAPIHPFAQVRETSYLPLHSVATAKPNTFQKSGSVSQIHELKF
jgi:hypothetical protein